MSSQVARTAVAPMAIVAIDQYEDVPLVVDSLAYRVLPAGVRPIVAVNRVRPVRRLMIRAVERKFPGLWASMVCRKRYIDDKLRGAVDEEIGAVVILGAGFDTRAYRFPWLAGTPVYEVDLPENINRKRSVLEKLFGRVPDHVTLVPIDFQAESLGEVLLSHGYRPGEKTFFVWEAVSQYLSETAVRATFRFLATAASGSRLVFTYVRKDFLDGCEFYGAEAAYREYVSRRRLWHFGLDPAQVGGFLTEYGWREVEQAGPREFATRYLVPNRRWLSASEVELSVSAEKS
ncbi:SAM-dependent methyltransferase [Saccharopolyspora phatthalungensis]|uniref:S-adenosyl-L-methionine-dependent methyltransferase n=1 Tax=Saccharopolyspora phatthalungensis TaxID=664693 RepID=A0A840QBC4_9PSEU|nr:SAM-dependent methyltransferase [Saccharopolyspora phatthalungensis]MBB5157091.1 methyltransferase (TIGR00027 family) [Saccharopolyspora phatthalungensis]